MAPEQSELSCSTGADCVISSAGDCGGCGCGTAVARGSLTAFIQRGKERCSGYSGPSCEVSCATVTFARCEAGRCVAGSAENLDDCLREGRASDEVAECRLRLAETTLQTSDCPDTTNGTYEAREACIAMIAEKTEKWDTCDLLVSVSKARCFGTVLGKSRAGSPALCARFQSKPAELRACVDHFLTEAKSAKRAMTEEYCAAVHDAALASRCRAQLPPGSAPPPSAAPVTAPSVRPSSTPSSTASPTH